jgi:hypothetical protein
VPSQRIYLSLLEIRKNILIINKHILNINKYAEYNFGTQREGTIMTGTTSKVARILRGVCDLSVGCTLVGTAGYVIWMLWLLLAPVIMRSGYTASSDFPVGIAEAIPVTGASSQTETISAVMLDATGVLKLSTSDRRVQILGYLDQLLFSVLILGLAYNARQFLVDVIDRRPFTFENARRLRWIGWLLLGWGLGKPLIHGFAASMVLSIVKIQSPVLTPPPGLDFPWILVSVFVLILSASFRYGVELEKESSLTV